MIQIKIPEEFLNSDLIFEVKLQLEIESSLCEDNEGNWEKYIENLVEIGQNVTQKVVKRYEKTLTKIITVINPLEITKFVKQNINSSYI